MEIGDMKELMIVCNLVSYSRKQCLLPLQASSSASSSSLSRKRPAQLDYLSASSSRITSRKSDSYLMQDHQKRRKVVGVQEKNRDLIDHLDRAGWK